MKISDFIYEWSQLIYKAKSHLKDYFSGKSIKILFEEYTLIVKNEYLALKQKVKNLRKTNYELGMMHYEKDNLSDAIFRFKLLRYFHPELLELNYLIGRCYIEQNQLAKSKPYIENYLNSNDQKYLEEAKYCNELVNLRYGSITSIPLSIVRRSFNILAPKYNEYFIDKPQSPQENVYRSINNYLSEIGNPYGNFILDLGCGTGYIAQLLKLNKSAASIVGIDISQAMINICQNLKADSIACYDSLLHQDIDSYLNENSLNEFNVIIASKLLSNYSNVDKLLNKSKEILKNKGCLVLTFKTTADAVNMTFDGYFEEFHYNTDFVTSAALKYGFNIKTSEDIKFLDGDMGRIMLLIKE